MASDCIFCKIVAGKTSSHKVYDDDTSFAFLDIKPLAKGHTLVVPKQHCETLDDLTGEQAAGLMRAVQTVSTRSCNAVGAPASTIAINNGKEAGQEVGHVHVHIVPRQAGDGFGAIHSMFAKKGPAPPEEFGALGTLAAKIRGK